MESGIGLVPLDSSSDAITVMANRQATSHKPQATSHKPQATSHKPQATSKPQASHKQATSKPQASHKQATNHKPQASHKQATSHKPQATSHKPQASHKQVLPPSPLVTTKQRSGCFSNNASDNVVTLELQALPATATESAVWPSCRQKQQKQQHKTKTIQKKTNALRLHHGYSRLLCVPLHGASGVARKPSSLDNPTRNPILLFTTTPISLFVECCITL